MIEFALPTRARRRFDGSLRLAHVLLGRIATAAPNDSERRAECVPESRLVNNSLG